MSLQQAWNSLANTNKYQQMYVKNFVDICGNLVLRNTGCLYAVGDASINRIFTNSDVSFGGNMYVQRTAILNSDVSINNRLFVSNDVSMNGNLYVKNTAIFNTDLSVNSRVFFPAGSIAASCLSGNLATSGGAVIRNDVVFYDADGFEQQYYGGSFTVASGGSVVRNDTIAYDGDGFEKTWNGGNFTVASPNLTVIGDLSALSRLYVAGDTIHTGGNVGIGKNPTVALDVSGEISAMHDISCTTVGYQALTLNTGNTNSAFGTQALYSNTSGSSNTAFGYKAIYDGVTAANNTAIGANTLIGKTSSYNVAIGNNAGNDATLYPNCVLYYPFNGDLLNYASGTGATQGAIYGSGGVALSSTQVKLGSQSLASPASITTQATGFNVTNGTALPLNQNGYTISFWYYATTYSGIPGGSAARLFTFAGPSAGNNKLDCTISSSGKFIIWSNAVECSLNDVTPLNAWNHYSFTLNTSGTYTTYINGNIIKTGTITYANNFGNTLYLMNDSIYNAYSAPGYLDDFRYYDGVLNAGQIQNIYNYTASSIKHNTTSCTFLGAYTNTNNSGYSQSTAIGYGAQITASNQVVLGTASETVKIPGNLTVSKFINLSGQIPSTAGQLGYIYTAFGQNTTTGTTSTTFNTAQLSLPSGVYLIYFNLYLSAGYTSNITVSSAKAVISTSTGTTVGAITVNIDNYFSGFSTNSNATTNNYPLTLLSTSSTYNCYMNCTATYVLGGSGAVPAAIGGNVLAVKIA